MAAIKALDEAGIRFGKHRGCYDLLRFEEAGLRGAKAYAKAHEKELKEIPTAVVALDTFRDLETMAVYDRDLSGTLKHHRG